MIPEETTAGIRQRAREEGFDLVGVARAAVLEDEARKLGSWLDDGLHASMTWMEGYRDRRIDPARLVPGCRSVVSLAMNYFPGGDAVPSGNRGQVARYARGRDYHRVFAKRLRRLSGWLESVTSGVARGFADSAPVMERAWALRSGIGWIGKNANLISPRIGSWLLLAEILTSAELEPDPGPHPDRCGTCTACIEACPTGAIVKPGTVDSRLCISYWTIEHRGGIPADLRGAVKDWLFGCDECQSVCPWNRSFARPAPADRFRHAEDPGALDPAELLRMDEKTFRHRFSGTPLMRAGWRGMRRNACIVLGNLGGAGDIEALERARNDSDPVVASHATWALERLQC